MNIATTGTTLEYTDVRALPSLCTPVYQMMCETESAKTPDKTVSTHAETLIFVHWRPTSVGTATGVKSRAPTNVAYDENCNGE